MGKSITNTGTAIAALFLCALTAIPSTVFADSGKPVPYKIKGTLFMTPREGFPGLYDFVDTGTSTYFGKYDNQGWLQFNADLTIAAGAGVCTAATGDYNTWVMEANTGRVISTGGIGAFEGVEGYFDSTIISMTFNEDGTITSEYTGDGYFTFPKKAK